MADNFLNKVLFYNNVLADFMGAADDDDDEELLG